MVFITRCVLILKLQLMVVKLWPNCIPDVIHTYPTTMRCFHLHSCVWWINIGATFAGKPAHPLILREYHSTNFRSPITNCWHNLRMKYHPLVPLLFSVMREVKPITRIRKMTKMRWIPMKVMDLMLLKSLHSVEYLLIISFKPWFDDIVVCLIQNDKHESVNMFETGNRHEVDANIQQQPSSISNYWTL